MSVEIGAQRVVERFDGSSIDERWTARTFQGSTTFAMTDGIDAGVELRSTTVQNRSQLDFNFKRYLDFDSCVIIGIFKNVSVNNTTSSIGATNNNFTGIQSMVAENRLFPTFLFQQLIVRDGVGTSNIVTTVPTDFGVPHRHKVEAFASSVSLTIDGILGATLTTNLPTVKLNPFCGHANDSGFASISGFSYIEAFNK